jgi:hypothetical protein
VQEFSAHPIEGEPVSTICCGLLVTPADRHCGQMAIEQRRCASVPNNRNIAVVGGLRDDLFDRANDPRLGICRGFPAPNAGLRLSKERINHCLELLLGEVARRRSVILAEAINDAVPVRPSPSAESCTASRALRSLLEKIWRTPLTQGEVAIACPRARPRTLSGQSGTGMLGSIATSGWAMKNTAGIDKP